jgi:hypothetical protein
MMLVRVVATQFRRDIAQGIAVETGDALLEVVESFHGKGPGPGARIRVHVLRAADPPIRARNNFNQWNNLNLGPGALILLACKPAEPPDRWTGIAGLQVDSTASPVLAAVRRAYDLEYSKAPPEQKNAMWTAALTSNEQVLRYFALDALGRRHAVPRNIAVPLVAHAVAAKTLQPQERLDLAAHLTGSPFFERQFEDDAGNQRVVSVLAEALLHEPGDAQRVVWARYLASCILMRFADDATADARIRAGLISATRIPATQLVDVLRRTALLAADDERKQLERLAAAWSAASR